ncbi:hypothetical protein TNCV_3325761 [Trichonephila clavipes]|nr:hypothetical protein TNCV_3325761 [Trichonephila clavipes]
MPKMQICITCTAVQMVSRHDAGQRRSVRLQSLEESILNVVADGSESSTRAVAHHVLPELLQKLPIAIRNRMWFQHGGASAHLPECRVWDAMDWAWWTSPLTIPISRFIKPQFFMGTSDYINNYSILFMVCCSYESLQTYALKLELFFINVLRGARSKLSSSMFNITSGLKKSIFLR